MYRLPTRRSLVGISALRQHYLTPTCVRNQRYFGHSSSVLSKTSDKDDNFVSPNVLVKENQGMEGEDKQVSMDKASKGPLLSDNKYEYGVKLPAWQEKIGEVVTSVFRLDVDRIRAGPIAGSLYYGYCKEQGLIQKDPTTGELTKTASYWYETLGLEPTFATWFQITLLHTWILFVRMRAMPFKYGKNYQQKLVDRFFSDMEIRLTNEMNITSGRIRDQYLKEFHTQLRGAVLGYDEGFSTDDLTLAYAVWRNLFNAKTEVDYVALESVVRYIRMQLYVLSKMSDREFGFGKFAFVSPDEVVYRLTEQEEKLLKERVYQEFESDPSKMTISNRSKLSLDN
ncbi:Cbp3 protein [Saccharomycopsis crataegensis]|uniref:Cbp3 protein n=1 Tax=Saccharomycopsis crataegensis TaxID=43959 RepID=A0AAV5QIF2_9ASCO|nr:Cbp3 protein [Saccharomycopsis crataegensis]